MSNYPDDDYQRHGDRNNDPLDDRYDDPEADQQTIAAARNRVLGPAIGLLITGVLGFVLAAVNAVQFHQFDELWEKEMKKIEDDPNIPANQKQEQLDILEKVGKMIKPIIIPQAILTALLSLIILLAGVNLLKLTSPGLVKTGAVLSFIPCLSPCCFLGLVFGIWTLVVMNRAEVIAGYTAMHRQSY
ncbi:MAG: hypothetical protein RMJ56_01650 [Gemmataceae bacterium]|nr:hypothetical protein [Gemmata sp.]MDW8196287.1 hypothetical protein [Gemmataceae bacterium]